MTIATLVVDAVTLAAVEELEKRTADQRAGPARADQLLRLEERRHLKVAHLSNLLGIPFHRRR